MPKTLRLILGDQLNIKHSWFNEIQDEVIYVLMEVKTESEYVKHHIQKIVGFFTAMRDFSQELIQQGHKVKYYKISDENNAQNFFDNLSKLIHEHQIELFEYQEPDEYRLDKILKDICGKLGLKSNMLSSEHFLTDRYEVRDFFGEKNYLMENFYRQMRKKWDVMMENGKPLGEKWNYDHENRKKIPKTLEIPKPFEFNNDVSTVLEEIEKKDIPYFGDIDPKNFNWPVNRKQGLEILDHFLDKLIENYGPYQDALDTRSWTNFHSRISFALNLKMIGVEEVIEKAEAKLEGADDPNIASIEGFIRQILGWREYMRGVYWSKMPNYSDSNFFGFSDELPNWFWDGNTKMNCMSYSVGQSLKHSYAHHIQRLMVTGNFALLMQCDPNEVDAWYLGVYIDAIEWVEITNTRGMSQFADGGLLSSKPYISSANYINKMGDYCKDCHYNHKLKHEEYSCPFNSLYWYFLESQRDKIEKNPRMKMPYNILNKMNPEDKEKIMDRAEFLLSNRHNL